MGERFGNYELVRRIAQGGMAEVFLAKFTGVEGFERWVVIKRMLPELSVRKDFVEMFLDEARLAARFNHPNIVQVYELGERTGTYFMAMEYVDGPHLGALFAHSLRSKKPMPINLCCYILARASEGLHHAHELKDPNGVPLQIVHRDVSPQNILVSRDADVKVMDFGVAKANSQTTVTRTGVVKGKVGYMSPEQCLANAVDRRTDVFALGIVLYELVTRKRLFRDKSDLVVMQKITQEDVPPPSSINPRVPMELDEIILKALQRDRDARTTDALTLSDELDSFLAASGEPTTRSTLARWMTDHGKDLSPGAGGAVEVSQPTPSWSQSASPGADPKSLENQPTRTGTPSHPSGEHTLDGDLDLPSPPATPALASNPSNPSNPALEGLRDGITTPPAPSTSRTPLLATATLAALLVAGGGIWLATRVNGGGKTAGSSSGGAASGSSPTPENPTSGDVAGATSGSAAPPPSASQAPVRDDKAAALRILTDPPNAEVTVNRVPRGTCENGALTVDKLTLDPPEASLVVSLEGYDTQRLSVPLLAGETITLPVIRLRKTAQQQRSPPGQFDITSEPSNLRVVIDGKAMGRTPLMRLELKEGNHALVVEAPSGYQTIRASIKSVAGVKQSLPYTLEKAERPPPDRTKEPEGTGKLVVNTDPYWTYVFFGGRNLGATPLSPPVEVPAGKVTLRLRRDGKDGCTIDVTRTVEVTANQVTRKVFTLDAKDAKGSCQ